MGKYSIRHLLLLFGLCLVLLQSGSLIGQEAVIQTNAGLNYGQWLGALGGSGLRRSLANSSDLGELATRTATSRLGRQLQRLHLANPANGGSLAGFGYEAEMQSYVVQWGGLDRISTQSGRHMGIDSIVRRAVSDEDNIQAQSDRLDVGLLWSSNYFADGAGYFGVNFIYEWTDIDIKFLNGERKGDGYGLRVQAGEVLSSNWAWSGRAERLWWEGNSFVFRPSPGGPLRVAQDVEFGRTYINGELIGRWSPSEVFGASSQLQWRSGIHYLESNYEDQLNNLGQPAVEPFGPNERLGLARTGVYLSWRAGSNNQWSPFMEWMYDYEFQNNLNAVINDSSKVIAKLGVARIFGRNQRVHLEYQHYQGLQGEWTRQALNLIAVINL